MKLAYLIGLASIMLASIAYLMLNGEDGYGKLEATLHGVPAWFFGEN